VRLPVLASGHAASSIGRVEDHHRLLGHVVCGPCRERSRLLSLAREAALRPRLPFALQTASGLRIAGRLARQLLTIGLCKVMKRVC
jgi:hypothetical protein